MRCARFLLACALLVGCDDHEAPLDGGLDATLPCIAAPGTLSLGSAHACGIRPDHALTCWGDDYLGKSTPPPGSFRHVSAGPQHSCAIRSDGTLACWGDPGSGALDAPDGSFTQVTTGWRASAALDAEGRVAYWGKYGRAGGLHLDGRYAQISAGWHVCALATTGVLECRWLRRVQDDDFEWFDAGMFAGPFARVSAASDEGGDQIYVLHTSGELELLRLEQLDASVRFGGEFVQLSAGSASACALTLRGQPRCFDRRGENPTAFGPGPLAQIEVGFRSICVMRADGTYECPGLWSTPDDTGTIVAPSANELLVECLPR